MKVIKSFFKQKETLLGIAIAIAFQLIFFIIWLTAYDGVFDRTNQLTVAVVNEDPVFGEKIERQLKENSLLGVKSYSEPKRCRRKT